MRSRLRIAVEKSGLQPHVACFQTGTTPIHYRLRLPLLVIGRGGGVEREKVGIRREREKEEVGERGKGSRE